MLPCLRASPKPITEGLVCGHCQDVLDGAICGTCNKMEDDCLCKYIDMEDYVDEPIK